MTAEIVVIIWKEGMTARWRHVPVLQGAATFITIAPPIRIAIKGIHIFTVQIRRGDMMTRSIAIAILSAPIRMILQLARRPITTARIANAGRS